MSDSRGITRRRFVAGAAGSAVALGVGVPLLGCGSDGGGGERGSVVVVGAGLAGLTAAYELDRKGWDVTVLEARDRVGGRCHTFRRQLDLGQVAEAGGEFIDASHKALRGYVDSFGLELDDLRAVEEEQDEEASDAIFSDGEAQDYEAVVDEAVQAELDRLAEQIDRYAAAIDVTDPARTGAGLDSRSVGDLLDELDLEPDARLIAEAELRGEYTVEPDQVSLLFHTVLSAVAADQADEDVERFRIRGGNDRLPDEFAERLRASLVLDSPVDAIQTRGSKVRVVADREQIEADFCVIATPLPVLRDIELEVELPRSVRNAIAQLQYGDVTKTALQYERRFWEDEGWTGEALTDLPVGTIWNATGSQPEPAGILMSYAAADEAEGLRGLEAGPRLRAAVEQVAEVFGVPASEDEFSAGATIAWRDERFSQGSYSAWAPGQYTRFWPALRRPYGRVYFAGEHTDLYASYMEGAVRSGRRVADAIEGRRG